MCEVLGVNRASFYEWLSKQPSKRMFETQVLAEKIATIFYDSEQTYGTRRIRRELNKSGVIISRRRIGKLMKLSGLSCKTKKKFRITTDSNHSLPIAPDLLQRDFSACKPNEKYVGDITYLWTQEGWLYLAIVIDLFSRKVVGWTIKKHMRASLVNEALLMAIWQRKPAKGLIWHTDRGSQYASSSHRDILKRHGIKQSMSRKGNCWDNSVAESFFGTLKTELTHHITFKTREEAKKTIFKYIEVFYNRKRIHSANDYLSPAEYEASMNF
jgi:transposase InsO family protein